MQTECIIWPKAKNKAGYGVTWHNNKWDYAHRVILNAPKDKIVMHLCDNPSCVNPDHLKLGSPEENSNNMVEKGRQCKGEKSHFAKLTEEQVLQIRQAEGSLRSIAKKFNTSHVNVGDIKKKRTWKHL